MAPAPILVEISKQADELILETLSDFKSALKKDGKSSATIEQYLRISYRFMVDQEANGVRDSTVADPILFANHASDWLRDQRTWRVRKRAEEARKNGLKETDQRGVTNSSAVAYRVALNAFARHLGFPIQLAANEPLDRSTTIKAAGLSAPALQAVRRSATRKVDAALVELALAGLTAHEIITLDSDFLIWDNGEWTGQINVHRSRRKRRVEIFSKHGRAIVGELLAPPARGKREYWVSERIRKIGRRAGTKATMRSLRRTGIELALRSDVSETRLRESLGLDRTPDDWGRLSRQSKRH